MAPPPVPAAAATGMMCPVRRPSVALAGLASLAASAGGAAGGGPGGGRGRRRRCAPCWAPASWTRPAGSLSMRPGDLFVADTGHCRVLWCRPRAGTRTGCTCGRAVRHPGRGACSGAGSIGHPSGVAVDAQGDVYIAEATAQRVQVVRPAGPGGRDRGGHGPGRLQR